MKRFDHIIRAVYCEPWAILPAMHATLQLILDRHLQGTTLSAAQIQEIMGAVPRSTSRRPGNVAVIPVYGVIQQHMGLMVEMSGGTSTEAIAAEFRQAVADPGVKAIVFNVDSPGGGVNGVEELSAEILAARGQKPMVAVANSLAASAAYWIACACDEVVVTPSGEMGSIGVFAAHEDMSRLYDGKGVTTTLISAGKYKTEGSPFAPLSEEARAAIQGRVDEYYGLFVNAVARGRGVTASAVRGGMGEGRVVGAKEAVRLGMADRVATLEQTVQRLGGAPAVNGARADVLEPGIEAADVVEDQVTAADHARRTREQEARRIRLA